LDIFDVYSKKRPFHENPSFDREILNA
jgi:hypothetical protein